MLYMHHANRFEAKEKFPKYVRTPSITYKMLYEKSWTDDDIVRRALKDIDKLDLEKGSLIEQGRHFTEIATGTKMIMLARFHSDDCWISSLNLGKNCYPYILEIAKTQDVHIVCVCTPDGPTDEQLEGHCVTIADDGKVVTTEDELYEYFDDWLKEWDDRDED